MGGVGEAGDGGEGGAVGGCASPRRAPSKPRESGGEIVVKYAIMIEKAGSHYSAYVPDLPGRVSTGESIEEIRESIREALALHIEGMREDGEAVPVASSRVGYVQAKS